MSAQTISTHKKIMVTVIGLIIPSESEDESVQTS